MAAVEEVNLPLLSKCLDFCQALASQGHVFNLSVAIGPSFSFSLDTRSKVVVSQDQCTKKKPSPSTLRRNAKRRDEFLARKQQKASSRISSDQATAEIKCDQCKYVAASEKGLRQHIRMKHKDSQPEKMREPSFQPPLSVSPLKDQVRVEPCHNSGMDTPNLKVFDCDQCGEVFKCGEDLETHTVWCPQCKELSCYTLNPSSTTCPGCSIPWEPIVQ